MAMEALTPPLTSGPALPTEHQLTVSDLMALSAAGAFPDGRRVELIDGRVLVSPADGPRHSLGNYGAGSALYAALAGLGDAREGWGLIPNIAFVLSDTRLLQPDWSVARVEVLRKGELLTPAHVALAVEVADSSLPYDAGEKKRLYAEAGLKELWIVRMGYGDVHVSREPASGVWGYDRLFARGETVSPLIAPDAAIAVEALLGEV